MNLLQTGAKFRPRPRSLFWILAGVVILWLIGHYVWPTVRANIFGVSLAERLTLNIKYNNKIYVSHNVVEVVWNRNILNAINSGGSWTPTFSGEAMTIDLPNGGTIALLLNRKGKVYPPFLPMNILGEPKPDEWGSRYFLRLASTSGIYQVPPKDLPDLIYFSDRTDPDTAQCLDPNHMETAFSPGTSISVSGATLEMVDEAPTTGIEIHLPWLKLSRRELIPLLKGPNWNSDQVGDPNCLIEPRYLKWGK